MEKCFLETVLKNVNASIYFIHLDTMEIEWVNNSLPFLTKLIEKKKYKENVDFKKNIEEIKEFLFKNPRRRYCHIFRMRSTNGKFGWFLNTAALFDKDIKGIPVKAIATAVDVSEMIDTNASLLNVLDEMQRSKYQSVLQTLTKREIEVTQLLTQGLNTKQIAKKLHRSTHTIETHRGNIKNKLGCKDVTEIPEMGYMFDPAKNI